MALKPGYNAQDVSHTALQGWPGVKPLLMTPETSHVSTPFSYTYISEDLCQGT